jgi:hypothetical protein
MKAPEVCLLKDVIQTSHKQSPQHNEGIKDGTDFSLIALAAYPEQIIGHNEYQLEVHCS